MTTVQSRMEEKRKPVSVVDYIANMVGVDKSDQMISYLPLHPKTVKWWKKLVLHLMTLVMIQAHTLYNKHRHQNNNKDISLEDFVKSVCFDLGGLPQNDTDETRDATGAAAPPSDVIS